MLVARLQPHRQLGLWHCTHRGTQDCFPVTGSSVEPLKGKQNTTYTADTVSSRAQYGKHPGVPYSEDSDARLLAHDRTTMRRLRRKFRRGDPIDVAPRPPQPSSEVAMAIHDRRNIDRCIAAFEVPMEALVQYGPIALLAGIGETAPIPPSASGVERSPLLLMVSARQRVPIGLS